jgi:hypothetical protein
MIKFFYLSLACLSIIACNNEVKVKDAASTEPGAVKNTDLVAMNLKARVKSIEETSYTLDSKGQITSTDSAVKVTAFDDKGYETSEITKKMNFISGEQQMEHYPGGQMKEMTTKKDGKLLEKWSIDLDDKGKYVQARIFDSTGMITSYWKELTENDYGQVTGGKEFHQDNTIKSSFLSNYKDGHYVGGWNKDSVGNETSRSFYQLNEKGDPAQSTVVTTTKDSSTTESLTYKYDAYDTKGNWTERTSFDTKGKPVKIIKRSYTYYKD